MVSNVYGATLRQLDWLRDHDALIEENEALGELALCLAAALDAGAGLAAAAVSRELRLTLQEIAKVTNDDDSEWTELVSGLGVAGISKVGYPKD